MTDMPDPVLWPNSFRITPHFRLQDFDCHELGGGVPYPEDLIITRLIPLCRDILEPIRHLIAGDTPVVVLSGWRTPTWNEHEGGAPDSRHLYGDAADIWCPSLGLAAGPALYLAVLSLHRHGILPTLGGLGKYPNRIHVDTRPHAPGVLALWDYTTTGSRG